MKRKEKEMEKYFKTELFKLRDTSDEISMRATYSDIEQKENFIEREGLTNGKALCTLTGGSGKTKLGWAFAGSINEAPKQFSDTVEYNPNANWSNGSDTHAIESKLRKRKKELGYVEPESRGGKRAGAGRKKKNEQP